MWGTVHCSGWEAKLALGEEARFSTKFLERDAFTKMMGRSSATANSVHGTTIQETPDGCGRIGLRDGPVVAESYWFNG